MPHQAKLSIFSLHIFLVTSHGLDLILVLVLKSVFSSKRVYLLGAYLFCQALEDLSSHRYYGITGVKIKE